MTVDQDTRRGLAPPYVSDWRTLREMTRCLPKGISMRARVLYHLLAGHTSADGLCNVSMETLAAEVGAHAGSVRKARAELEEHGLVVTFVGGGNRANLYCLPDFRLSTPRAVWRDTSRRSARGRRERRWKNARAVTSAVDRRRDDRRRMGATQNGPTVTRRTPVRFRACRQPLPICAMGAAVAAGCPPATRSTARTVTVQCATSC